MAASAVGILPMFLVGTQAVPIRRELGFGEAGLGLVVAGRAAVAALASVPLGDAPFPRWS